MEAQAPNVTLCLQYSFCHLKNPSFYLPKFPPWLTLFFLSLYKFVIEEVLFTLLLIPTFQWGAGEANFGNADCLTASSKYK